jgi:hypothetical protein
MTEYYAFYDNISVLNKKVVPVAFASHEQAERFIYKFQNYGGYRQFNYDAYGNNKKSFVDWLNNNFPPLAYGLSRERQIVKYRGKKLFRYMMSIFGIKIR